MWSRYVIGRDGSGTIIKDCPYFTFPKSHATEQRGTLLGLARLLLIFHMTPFARIVEVVASHHDPLHIFASAARKAAVPASTSACDAFIHAS